MDFLSQVTSLKHMGENVERVVRPNVFPQTIADSSSSAVIAFFIIGITSGAFLLSSDQINHWFLIPISICGVLMSTYAIEWFRGRLGLYGPGHEHKCFRCGSAARDPPGPCLRDTLFEHRIRVCSRSTALWRFLSTWE